MPAAILIDKGSPVDKDIPVNGDIPVGAGNPRNWPDGFGHAYLKPFCNRVEGYDFIFYFRTY